MCCARSKTSRGLDQHLSEWEQDPASTPLGFVLTMEGADGIVSAEQIPQWREEGLRVASLCHYGISSYAHGTQTEGGLTSRGRPFLQALQESGMILDTTHLAEQAFWEALEVFNGPVVATHNCCRVLCDHDRQFTDPQLQALIQRDAVIGVALDVWMVSPLWNAVAQDNSGITMETVADHIDHICQLAGNALHVGIGSDLDGGYGKEQSPSDMETIADLQKLSPILEKRGYSSADTAKILHGNWIRLLRTSWT